MVKRGDPVYITTEKKVYWFHHEGRKDGILGVFCARSKEGATIYSQSDFFFPHSIVERV